jgi:3-deoxy-D-manno-octulosonic-acid transferase
VRRSRGESAADTAWGDSRRAVFLADTTGELMGLFGIASAAFVGKSLCAHGSQNMIEPCLCGIPTIVGPYTENFRPVMSDLLAAGAIVQVKDELELGRELKRSLDLSERAYASALGEKAKAAVERRRGATEKCARDILSFLE